MGSKCTEAFTTITCCVCSATHGIQTIQYTIEEDLTELHPSLVAVEMTTLYDASRGSEVT